MSTIYKNTDKLCLDCNKIIQTVHVKNPELDDWHYSCNCDDHYYFVTQKIKVLDKSTDK